LRRHGDRFSRCPFLIGLKTYDKGKLTGQTYSRLEPHQDLVLADLVPIPRTVVNCPEAPHTPVFLVDPAVKNDFPLFYCWCRTVNRQEFFEASYQYAYSGTLTLPDNSTQDYEQAATKTLGEIKDERLAAGQKFLS